MREDARAGSEVRVCSCVCVCVGCLELLDQRVYLHHRLTLEVWLSVCLSVSQSE